MTSIVGDYQINYDNFLGSGSYSTVYAGTHLNSNKKVAVKIIDICNGNGRLLSCINEEINILKKVSKNPHPNIIKCYDVIRKPTKIYIILEYCDSGDLASILKGPIKEKYAQYYFSQLANGMRYLKDLNIIHRDIKPKNVLLTENKSILKIADFGFAKQMGESYSLHDTVCGSPLYMAPEIMNKLVYNDQTDLWSLGMILYEMLYGTHPYKRCKNMDELVKHANENTIEIPPSNTKNTEVSEKCLALLKNLLEYSIGNRITWTEFFDNPWVSKYRDVELKTSSNLDNSMNSIVDIGNKVNDQDNNNDSECSDYDLNQDLVKSGMSDDSYIFDMD